MATILHSAPRFAAHSGLKDALVTALGSMLIETTEEHGELLFLVHRDRIADALLLLRDEHGYQQLMEIAGVDFPQREERFEVVYMLLSVTKNHRIMLKVTTDEETPVPTATTIWPNAGWLEREVFDLYGVLFDGNPDLRRILTDYGFEGHPFRKDFPLTGYSEVRYSEEEKRVIYEPVELAQDFRSFDFTSPWEGSEYVLPGDEKAAGQETAPPVKEAKTTDSPEKTGANAEADEKAAKAESAPNPAEEGDGEEPGAPAPTEDRPDRAEREDSELGTKGATETGDDDAGKGSTKE